MAFSFGRNIVMTGLVLNLDAANIKSYTGSGTMWNDMSGNASHATSVNSPTFSSNNAGYFMLNGTTQYFTCPPSANFNFGTGDCAVESWIYWDGTYTNTGREIYATGGSGSLDQFGIFSGSGLIFGSVFQNVAANYPTVNQWAHCVGTRIGTTIRLYINSAETASGTQAGSIGSSTAIPSIGYRIADSQHPFSGRIAAMRIYKGKGLTAAEVKQNFDATRSRYGL